MEITRGERFWEILVKAESEREWQIAKPIEKWSRPITIVLAGVSVGLDGVALFDLLSVPWFALVVSFSTFVAAIVTLVHVKRLSASGKVTGTGSAEVTVR